MPDVIPALRRCEQRERSGDQRIDVLERPRPGGAQECLQFGEGQFDRIEVWTVGWQEAELGPDRFDRRTNLGLSVHRQVVEDDDIAGLEHGHQHLLDIRAETGGVDRPVEDRWRREAAGGERRDDRVRLPVAARGMITQPNAAQTAPVAAQQVGRDAALIDEQILMRVVHRLGAAPAAPLSDDVGPSLFVGVYGFF